VEGNILKMRTTLAQTVEYVLPIGEGQIAMNERIGQTIKLHYQGEIHCVACGRKTNKSFSQGHCYPCFKRLAACDMCIMKPETCHYDAGTCREPQWGEDNCFQPHYVYLANSSGVKVGITRGTQIPTRWMDQGAGQALPIFKVATRLQSGLLEVALKEHISDRTDWRKMLKQNAKPVDLKMIRDELIEKCDTKIANIKQQHGSDAIEQLAEEVVEINYPITQYPEKIKSLNFDKQSDIEGELQGIKGQYLILDTGVLNIRKFSGYNIRVDFD